MHGKIKSGLADHRPDHSTSLIKILPGSMCQVSWRTMRYATWRQGGRVDVGALLERLGGRGVPTPELEVVLEHCANTCSNVVLAHY